MAQETAGTTPKTYNLTHPRNGRRVTVTGLSRVPPTQEEVDEIFRGVYGEGMLTKTDIPSLTAVPASIGAGVALGTAAKRIPAIAAVTGTAGALGELSKQWQTPSRVGDWNITSIEEPAWMGTTTRTFNPQSLLSRGGNIVKRGLEEGGLDIFGASVMQLPRMLSRGLQTMAMGSKRLPSLQAESGEKIIEQSLREGIGPSSTRAGRRWLHHDPRAGGTPSGKAAEEIGRSADAVDLLIARVGGGNTPLVDVSREGSFFSDVVGADSPIRGKTVGDYLQILNDFQLKKPLQDFRDLDLGDEMGAFFDRYITNPQAQKARSTAEEFRLPRPSPNLPDDFLHGSVRRSDTGIPLDEVSVRVGTGGQLRGGPQVRRIAGEVDLGGPPKVRPTDPAGDTRLLGGPFSDVEALDVHGATALIPRSKGLTSAGDISLEQAISDKRFLEQVVLPSLYKGLDNTGTAAQASRAQTVAKAIRDALSKRIKETLELGEATGRMPKGVTAIYESQNRRTQELNRFLEMIQESPHLGPSPFSWLSPAESLAARGIETFSRYGYTAPQNILRAMQTGQLDNAPPALTTDQQLIGSSRNAR